ncbi:MAG: hypothetical protein ACRDF6_06375 [bacterium]
MTSPAESLSEEDLAKTAAAMGLSLDRVRIRAILPEVRRLFEAARRLRELPIDPTQEPRVTGGP